MRTLIFPRFWEKLAPSTSLRASSELADFRPEIAHSFATSAKVWDPPHLEEIQKMGQPARWRGALMRFAPRILGAENISIEEAIAELALRIDLFA